MENWSPRTLVKTGFCRVDDDGKIVSIWNFGDLDEVLNRIKSDEECEGSPDRVLLQLSQEVEDNVDDTTCWPVINIDRSFVEPTGLHG